MLFRSLGSAISHLTDNDDCARGGRPHWTGQRALVSKADVCIRARPISRKSVVCRGLNDPVANADLKRVSAAEKLEVLRRIGDVCAVLLQPSADCRVGACR